MLTPVQGHDARDVLGRVDDEVVPREHVFLGKLVDAADVVELAVADLILVAIGVFPAAVPLRQRPWLVGNDAIRRVDDETLAAEHAEAARMLLEDDGMRDATRRSVEGS